MRSAVLLFATLPVHALVASAAVWEQFSLNYNTSASEMVVSFAASTTASTAECLYGPAMDQLSSSATATGSTYSMGSYLSPMLFKARLTGLTPGNKAYYYQCGTKELGYSSVQSFKSHPGVGKSDVTFHLFGDLGQTANSNSTLAELIAYESTLDGLSGGIISMGDLSYANGDEPLWDTFGRLREMATKNIPMMTTLGNHEWFDSADYSFLAYRARFDNPLVGGVRQLYYSFNAGLVHWVMVAGYCAEMKSTSTQPCLAVNSPQFSWLQEDLATVDRSVTPWVMVVFHEPYVNSNTAHPMKTEGAPMQAAIEDTLYKYKVDVVFSGHVHAYERSCRVYKYQCVADGPYYITIGDGGNAEGLATAWVQPQPAWSVFRQASYGFGELRVVNSSYVSWRWHQNQDLLPTIADAFTITKQSAVLESIRSVTGKPVFADSARGRTASLFNDVALENARSSPHSRDRLSDMSV